MSNVIYANALSKALESNLLGKERLYRMIDSMDASEALKILSEVNFGGSESLESPTDFENLLKTETNFLFDFIKANCASEGLKAFLLMKNDFHNAETFIKSKYVNFDTTGMVVPSGLIDSSSLKEKIFADEYKSFDKEMQEALNSIDLLLCEKKATGDKVNAIMEKAYFEALLRVAKNDKFLWEFYKAKADSVNISVALRTRDFIRASEMYIGGANISLNDLKVLCEEQADTIREKFRFSNCKELVFSAIEDFEKSKALCSFEKISDDYVLTFLKKYKYSNDGIIPFMTYCFNKLAEIQNVRIIMVGLINGHESDQIKKRLRVSYAW